MSEPDEATAIVNEITKGMISIDRARQLRGHPPFPAEPDAPEWSHWRYTGPGPRSYSNVPVTVVAGDVVGWWGEPRADGCWEATDDDVTKLPDNHRPEPTEADAARLRGDEPTEE